jgi:RecA/RadA recombinase
MIDDNKKKETDKILESLRNKGYNIYRGAERPKELVTGRVPTGITAVDTALGGGLPKGMVTTIWGPFNCGKTWFCMEVAKKILKEGGQVLYIDLEGITPTFETIQRTIGINTDEIIILKATEYGDQIVDIVEDFLFDKKTKKPKNLIDLVIVDSISNIVTKANLDKADSKGSADGGKVGSHAKLMTDWLSRYYGRGACEGNQIVLLISQVRAYINTGGGKGAPEFIMSGGNAILHNSKVIIRFGKKNIWVDVKEKDSKAERKLVGHTVLLNIERNATTGLQGIKTEYAVKYGTGIDDADALVAKAMLPDWGYIVPTKTLEGKSKRGYFTIICPGLGDVEVKGKANLTSVVRSRIEISDILRSVLNGPKPLAPPSLIGVQYVISLDDEDVEDGTMTTSSEESE